MRKTTHEIIDETAAAYNLNTRSVTHTGRCVYIGPENRHCAFSRIVENPKVLADNEGFNCKRALEDNKAIKIKEEYAGYSVDFYYDLQSLHDHSENWTATGLAPEGMVKVHELKEKWPIN